MRFVLALFLVLWLPLQATAAIALGVCADHGRAAATEAVGPGGGAPSSHRHHAAGEASAACDGSAAALADATAGAPTDACSHCSLCAASAAPCVAVNGTGRDALVAAAELARHALSAIAVVPPDLIHRPPIVAAA